MVGPRPTSHFSGGRLRDFDRMLVTLADTHRMTALFCFAERLVPGRRRAIGLLLFSLSLSAVAHEGHDHGPKLGGEAAASGPVVLAPHARANLGIETFEVEIGSVQRSVLLLARVEAMPEKTARISARIEGHVAEIHVRLGQKVHEGERLATVAPLVIDAPPVILQAPFNGVVTAQNAVIGTPLDPETVLVEIADLSEVLVRGVAYENADLSEVLEGAPASVRLDFFRNEIFHGTIERIAPALDPATRTFEIYALVPNPELRLKPGLQGVLHIGVGAEQMGVTIPERAVLGSIGNLSVFVETEVNTFERHPVVLGLKLADRVEVLEGVLPGDHVVVRGNYQLQFATSQGDDDEDSPEESVHTHADGSTHQH